MTGSVKYSVLLNVGVLFSFIAGVFGGWDAAMQALVMLIVADYTSGVVVAGVFKNSDKSANGGLESKASFKGLIRKGMVLLIILVSTQLDRMLNCNNFVRDAIIYAFCANELISIMENAQCMGIKIPAAFSQLADTLKRKASIANKTEPPTEVINKEEKNEEED